MQAMPLWERHAARLAWTAFALTALFALAAVASETMQPAHAGWLRPELGR